MRPDVGLKISLIFSPNFARKWWWQIFLKNGRFSKTPKTLPKVWATLSLPWTGIKPWEKLKNGKIMTKDLIDWTR